jgi:hypothetical protein
MLPCQPQPGLDLRAMVAGVQDTSLEHPNPLPKKGRTSSHQAAMPFANYGNRLFASPTYFSM